MAGKRKVQSAAFKAQVALAAYKGDRTANELGRRALRRPSDADPTPGIRSSSSKASRRPAAPACLGSADAEARQAELFEQIGRLKVELEWLKKVSRALCVNPSDL